MRYTERPKVGYPTVKVIRKEVSEEPSAKPVFGVIFGVTKE